MKYLYIVDYWVPFPSSEYGGLINVIAENDIECHDILYHLIMTHNIAHTNKMLFDLKQMYQTRISSLQDKINEQEQEIAKLKTLISLLTIDREYDC